MYSACLLNLPADILVEIFKFLPISKLKAVIACTSRKFYQLSKASRINEQCGRCKSEKTENSQLKELELSCFKVEFPVAWIKRCCSVFGQTPRIAGHYQQEVVTSATLMRMRDATGHDCLRSSTSISGLSYIRDIRGSADGNFYGCAGCTSDPPENICAFRIKRDGVLHRFGGHNMPIWNMTTVQLDSGDALLATQSSESITLLHTSTGRFVRQYCTESSSAGSIQLVQNFDKLTMYTSYATLSIYDLTRYNGMSSTTEFIDLDFLRVADIEEESGALFDIEGDSMIRVRSAVDGHLRTTIPSSSQYFSCISLRDNQTVCLGAEDGFKDIVDIERAAHVISARNIDRSYYVLQYEPQLNRAAFGTTGGVELYDIRTSLTNPSMCLNISDSRAIVSSFQLDDRWAYVASWDGYVHAFDVRKGELASRRKVCHEDPRVWTLEYSNGLLAAGTLEGRVIIWDVCKNKA